MLSDKPSAQVLATADAIYAEIVRVNRSGSAATTAMLSDMWAISPRLTRYYLTSLVRRGLVRRLTERTGWYACEVIDRRED
jgi:hypothetical protein